MKGSIYLIFAIVAIFLIFSASSANASEMERQLKGDKTKKPSIEKTKKPTMEKTKKPSMEKTPRPTGNVTECDDLKEQLCANCVTIIIEEEAKECIDDCVVDNFSAFNSTGCVTHKQYCKYLVKTLCDECDNAPNKGQCMKQCVTINKPQLEIGKCMSDGKGGFDGR